MDQLFSIIDIQRFSNNQINCTNQQFLELNNKILLSKLVIVSTIYIIPKIIDFFKILFMFL